MSARGGRRDGDEMGMELDFDLDLGLDGAPGPARRLSSARIASMVSSIVDEATASAPEPLAPNFAPPISPFDVTRTVVFEPPASSPRRFARRGAVLTAALVAASVGSAAAAVWIVVGERPSEQPAASAPQERRPVRTRRPAAADVVPAPAVNEPADEDEEQIEENDEEIEPAPVPRKRVREPRRPRSQRQGVRPKRSEPEVPEVKEAQAVKEPAQSQSDPVVLPPDAPVEDIVALANQRRKEKRWRAAEELYERARRDHAGTDAATIATVASASLHLDHLADPAGALVRFRRALRLRPDGPLAEEARWGLAETHRALGDDAAERAALRAFLSAHPASVNAARARQRLAELAGP